MTRFMLAAALVLSTFAFAAVALAAKTDANAPTKTGKIKSVDTDAKTFVVDIEGKPSLTFKINDKTTYSIDGKEVKMAEVVKADTKVTVTYTRDGKDRIATKVEVTTEKKDGEKKE